MNNISINKQIGKIKLYRPEQGYGFITTLESTEDIFFHITKFIDDTNLEFVVKDAQVNFNIIKKAKGYQAIRIELILV